MRGCAISHTVRGCGLNFGRVDDATAGAWDFSASEKEKA
jgi:hypothetical protein